MIGSCFTENIGNYLKDHYFPVLTNPCGILYNPASMASCIDLLVKDKQIAASDLFMPMACGTTSIFTAATLIPFSKQP